MTVHLFLFQGVSMCDISRKINLRLFGVAGLIETHEKAKKSKKYQTF